MPLPYAEPDVPHAGSCILVADSDESFRTTTCRHLDGWTKSIAEADCPQRALLLAEAGRIDVAVVGEFGCGAWEALNVAQRLCKLSTVRAVIFAPKASSEDLAIAALRAGVSDYLRRPIRTDDLTGCIGRCARTSIRGCAAAPGESCADTASGATEEFVCASSGMLKLRGFLQKVSRTDSNVLVTGESGTGKELVARLVHQLSPNSAHPLVYVNCAALPDTLLESELFGYERGAFTGASRSHPGRFRQAARGTLVLDEIGEMTPMAQAKLLRAIESRQIAPLGGQQLVPLEARIVAATNQDPETLLRERRFRSDLYYRLNVARVHIAPLRERKEDVLPLFQYFITSFNRRRGTAVKGPTHEVSERLLCYDWPGNVRELRNVVETIFIDPPDGEIEVEHLPEALRNEAGGATNTTASPGAERERLLAALTATRWNKSEAAKQLHWSRMTLYRKMTKYDLSHSR